MIVAIEAIGARHEGGVATVGRAAAPPGAVNVHPGEVALPIDARAPSDAMLAAMLAEIDAACSEIARRRASASRRRPSCARPCQHRWRCRVQQALADAARAS